MSFGISAATWAAVGAGAATALGVYGIDQAQKGQYRQRLALDEAAAEDARKTAEAETGAQVAANAKIADTKRRRRGSALSLGDPNGIGTALGGQAGPVLAPASPAAAARPAYAGASTALGSGAAAGGGYGGGGGRNQAMLP